MSASQLEAFVINGDAPDKGCWVQLPINKEDFLWAVAAIGVTDPAKDCIRVTMVEPEREVLTPHLKEPFDLNELNFFANRLEKLEGLNEEQFRAFSACLQAERHCGSVADMINLLESIDFIDLQPAFTPEQYGTFLIDLAQDEYADEMEALENSESPSKTGFADYISDLERCLDVKAYGRLMAEREGGVFTDFGYLTESATFLKMYHGVQGIPAEFLVSPFPNTELPLKLENTDLTDVLTKIHDLGGYTKDLENNLKVLHRRSGRELLLLLTEDKAYLTETMRIYHRDTSAHDSFVETTDARVFSIFLKNYPTDFIGDICETDTTARRADILKHSIDFASVEVQTAKGESGLFTAKKWNSLSQAERNAFPHHTKLFDNLDSRTMCHHIEDQSWQDRWNTYAVSPEMFFDKLAKNLPAKAERAFEKRPKSVLVKIAAARRKQQPHKPEAPKHRTEPER